MQTLETVYSALKGAESNNTKFNLFENSFTVKLTGFSYLA